jgi:preprotein translocase subunit SecY
MASIAESVRNIWKIEELRRRILYTLGILVVYRVGAYVTLPGVDAGVLAQVTAAADPNNLFGFLDLFVGGAFSMAGIFALGIMPYITASIIIQLMGAVVPYFQKLQREGEDGRRKITQLTRYGTVGITALQAIGFSINLQYGATGQAIVVDPTFFMVSTVIVLTAGTLFVMWLGERITENGIGNGISLIIMIGIVAFFPQSLINEFQLTDNLFIFLLEVGMFVLVTAGVVLVTQGMRRIPVQYAKRVVGRKVYGGTTQYLPLRVNAAGVMPIIFAQSIMFVPATIASFFPESAFMQQFGGLVYRHRRMGIRDRVLLHLRVLHLFLHGHCGEPEGDGRHDEASGRLHPGDSAWQTDRGVHRQHPHPDYPAGRHVSGAGRHPAHVRHARGRVVGLCAFLRWHEPAHPRGCNPRYSAAD